MSSFHKHSLFPFAVIALSFVLAGFMYWTFQDRQDTSPITQEEVEPVNTQAYQEELAKALRTFEERFAQASTSLEKQQASETALASLLRLRVPAEYKDLHLGLAVAFNQIGQTLQSENGNVQIQLETIAVLKADYSWLE